MFPWILCFVTTVAFADTPLVPATHPRLLLTPADVTAIRIRCGTEPAGAAGGKPRARFGSQREVFERLRDTTRRIMLAKPSHDDLFAPAMLHLVTGRTGQADDYTHYVADALLAPERRQFDLDAIVALDWCWDAIELADRLQILQRLPLIPEPFDPQTSPLDRFLFHRRLCGLAQAIVRYDPAEAEGAEMRQLARVITAGRDYFAGPFVEFCRQRGAMPTSGEQGIWEEADYTFALELLRTGLNLNLWPVLEDSFGRSMEHYFYAQTDYPGLDHGFIHDDGTQIPARPTQIFRGFSPAVPWAIARQTRDPVAIWYANRSLPFQGEIILDVDRYGWVRLLYSPIDEAEADRRAAPLARNFGGGWVAMRTGWRPEDTVVLFDAGQPFWRSRQHFDAGQFQIIHKGRLAVPSGDDVTFEAVGSKQGVTLIDRVRGDWDHYFRSTVAHNCVTVADRKHIQSLYGRPWPAMGNQRLIGRSWNPALGDIAGSERETGRLLAFETNPHYSYAAADLTPAYDPRAVKRIRRDVLLLHAGAVLVLDRLTTTSDKSLKHWNLQLQGPPRVLRASVADETTSIAEDPHQAGDAGQGLTPASMPHPSTEPEEDPAPPDSRTINARQIFGVEPDAGIWQPGPDQPWIVAPHLDGKLFVRTLLPAAAVRRIMGGPRHAMEIPDGPGAGRTYYGGSPDGFEYRLWPAEFFTGPTATYELGRPTLLGPQFGVGASWGRLEVSPAEATGEVVFLHLLIPADADADQPPPVQFEMDGMIAQVRLRLAKQQIHIGLALDPARPSAVSIHDADGRSLFEGMLATEVMTNEPIPRLSLRRP